MIEHAKWIGGTYQISFYLESSQSDHYWGRYEWLQLKWVPNGYLGRKGLIYSTFEVAVQPPLLTEQPTFTLSQFGTSVHLNDLKAVGVVGVIIGIVGVGIVVGVVVAVCHKYSRMD